MILPEFFRINAVAAFVYVAANVVKSAGCCMIVLFSKRGQGVSAVEVIGICIINLCEAMSTNMFCTCRSKADRDRSKSDRDTCRENKEFPKRPMLLSREIPLTQICTR